MVSDNPFMSRAAKKGGSGHGKKSEERVARSIGARLTPNSGAVQGAKGDMEKKMDGQKVKIESKSTVHNTLSIDLGWFVKIATEALVVGATPAVTLSFVTPEGKARNHGEWVAVPMHVWKELVEK